ncbi:BadF/BadG/BcrA/BcrD ATPase family protein [Croceibacter atlanticus]|jgi:N-acetylglucosamine kinase-like BadF-type ATPase|uniref:BadF/BadG/BcrA/BcrD ATPase family protein n=1 Tax=Croceibacter atlanticus TaxID=313588 RepID=UPI002E12E5B1|nr:BadF/BadG/BcrA/BcrD ATPase family protein [Croceibacter atlanticus]
MVLIADGGSTKCDWILLDSNGDVKLKTRTLGLNPAVFKQEVLEERLKENSELKSICDIVETVHFYGAGCGTKTPKQNLKETLQNYFYAAKEIEVNEDMAAAVYAATTKPGIVCILGTGSNSCYFDGKDIHMAVDSLGYILMDEASGNYFGKRLIRDYYYNKMPKKLKKEFAARFDLDSDVIKMNLYKKENPNMYLASFAEFIFTSEVGDLNAYFYKLIEEGMLKFIERRILCFKEAQHVPIHFIGSIAHFSEDIIRECFEPYQLELGSIIRRPIDGLIQYYKDNIL